MVLPVILALIFAATVLPLVDALVRRGQSRSVAAAVAVGGATLAIVGVLALTLVSLVNQAEEVGDTAVAGAEEVNEAAGGLLGLGADAIESGTDSVVQTILDVSSSLASVGDRAGPRGAADVLLPA